MEENLIDKLNEALHNSTSTTPSQLSSILDELKYLTYGNKRRKRELLSRSTLKTLVMLFENGATLDAHRESIFNIISSLQKSINNGNGNSNGNGNDSYNNENSNDNSTDNDDDEQIAQRIFRLCCAYINDDKLGVSALRAASSLMRYPLPKFVFNTLMNDPSDRALKSLLKQSSPIKQHFMLKMLSFLMQDKTMLGKLFALNVSGVINSHLFPQDLQQLELALQCLLHLTADHSVALEYLWHNKEVLGRMTDLIGPFFPARIQIATVRCLLDGVQALKSDAALKERILQGCLLSLIRCCRRGDDEMKRAEAVGLLSQALSLRDVQSEDEDSRYLKEMFLCVLPTPSTSSSRDSPINAALQSNALNVISQLLLNSEQCRANFQTEQLIATAQRISRRDSTPQQVKALLRVLHALSRSVHHLKTTFDSRYFVRFAIDCLLNESDTEFLTLATALIANLALHFCSARSLLTEAVVPLAALAQRKKNPSITLNAVWALMNLSCQSTAPIKLSILGHFPSSEALALLTDGGECLFTKMLSLYRNLYCQNAEPLPGDLPVNRSPDILNALSEQSYKNAAGVVEMIKRAFNSEVLPDTKEIALNLLVNLCAVPSCQIVVANDDRLIECIMEELRSMDTGSHLGAVMALSNLLSGDERIRHDVQSLLSLSALPYLLSGVHHTSTIHNVHYERRVNDTIRYLIG